MQVWRGDVDETLDSAFVVEFVTILISVKTLTEKIITLDVEAYGIPPDLLIQYRGYVGMTVQFQ